MIVIDPEETETAALNNVGAELTGKRILEVGCGDGRLTWRYALRAGTVLAVDPDAEEIALALAATPVALRGRVEFRAAGLEALRPDAGPFDAAVLAWSL